MLKGILCSIGSMFSEDSNQYDDGGWSVGVYRFKKAGGE